jgi:hypothetical protein
MKIRSVLVYNGSPTNNTVLLLAGTLYTNSQTYNISSTPGASRATAFEYLGGQKSSLAPTVCIVTYANIKDVEFISKWVCLPYA